MKTNENSIVVPADEPKALHRKYIGCDSALEENHNFRDSSLHSERFYAEGNSFQRECAKKRALKNIFKDVAAKRKAALAVKSN